jgi:hypothetical protein
MFSTLALQIYPFPSLQINWQDRRAGNEYSGWSIFVIEFVWSFPPAEEKVIKRSAHIGTENQTGELGWQVFPVFRNAAYIMKQ